MRQRPTESLVSETVARVQSALRDEVAKVEADEYDDENGSGR